MRSNILSSLFSDIDFIQSLLSLTFIVDNEGSDILVFSI
jgi:hypothetical protein